MVLGSVVVVAAPAGPAPGLSGDGGAATSANLNAPTAIALLPGGGFLIADSRNHRIRKVV